jgi:hypothetical protein
MTTQKMILLAQKHLATGTLSPAEASKLRGLGQWADSELFGRPARACLSVLASRQYGAGTEVTMELQWALDYLIDIANMAAPRHYQLRPPLAPPLVLYTDAAEEPGPEGSLCVQCGFVLVEHETTWGSFHVPNWLIATWKNRKKQITVTELLVAPVVALSCKLRQHIQNRDLLWFIDNSAALSCLVKASSPHQDMASLAMLAQVALHSAQARPWYEWVRSSANLADAPSRGAPPATPRGMRSAKSP